MVLKSNFSARQSAAAAALLCSALSGSSITAGLEIGGFTASLLAGLHVLGAEFICEEDTALCLSSVSPGGVCAIDCGGEALPCLLSPIAALIGRPTLFSNYGGKSAEKFFNMLATHGAAVERTSAGALVSGALVSGVYELRGSFCDYGLLTALPLLSGDSTVNFISPENDSEIAMQELSRRGIAFERIAGGLRIAGGQRYTGCDTLIN